jgi:hypothetical protein
MTSKYHWDESDLIITRSVEKHLSGKHDQKMHAGRRGAVDSAVASGGSTKGTAPKTPRKTARQKMVDSLTLGVDYDSEGYPLDNAGGIVAQKLADIHGLYDEASDEAMVIAGRGPKNLILPRDKDGLPQILPLKTAEKRYGKTPEEVIATVEKKFGIKITTSGNTSTDETMDTLHGMAQAIEELSMNGVPVSKMIDTMSISMERTGGVLGSFNYIGRQIDIRGGNIASQTSTFPSPSKIINRRFGAGDSYIDVGVPHGESIARSAYGTTIHEVGHAMDLYVGTQIHETRRKIINDVFEGTGLIRSDWAETYRGREILYTNRESNATAYYNDLGAEGLIRLTRAGTIDPQQSPSYGNVGDKVSFSQYATFNMRENFAETVTAYWLYGGSKGKYKKYYDGYKERIGNIVDMSQGIIKAVNPAGSSSIVTDINKLPPSHPLMVWITGIVPS